ncbi:MAG: Superkiller protein 3 [Piccolia ochrophora]|nr:MAG: Superkiller protein 3 [Piccolia ochrophora]
MSGSKAALKAAKAAIDKGHYEDAVTNAQKVLAVDDRNYHANVFLGVALEKQGKDDDAERAYVRATEIKDAEALAWQGLVSLYEKQSTRQFDGYRRASTRLAEIYMNGDDKVRCRSVLEKFQSTAKEKGTRAQYRDALQILLPPNPLYQYLEESLPRLDTAYKILAAIIESEEREQINKEIGERRTRLGARLGEVTLEVKREVLGRSKLEDVYQNVIDWSYDDDIRREYEEKQLQHAYDTLEALQLTQKPDKRATVQKLAEGMVIIKHPFKLAWDIAIEWQDRESLTTLDYGTVMEYVRRFPTTGLGKTLQAYLGSDLCPLPPENTSPKVTDGIKDAEEDEKAFSMSANDRLLLMTEGVQESSHSPLSHRILAEFFFHLEEYESAVETTRRTQKLLHSEKRKSGLRFQDTLDAVDIVLGNSLIYYQTPKNHPEARSIFEDVLTRKPTLTSALIGVGLIFEEQEEYKDAIEYFNRAIARDPSNVKIRAEAAWCRALTADYSQAQAELESCVDRIEGKDTRAQHLKAQILYRLGVCSWQLDPSPAARKDRKGAYARFLAALQADMNFAPAYTSLGIYYADYAKDKKRSRKCFHKAFEISASEIIAAERLARSFADQKEWDLVETVAQRAVESGKVNRAPGSKRKGVAWPFAALGVVELNRQEYARSLLSFQTALRISPEDYHSWVGLGESYHNSGRYIAATKALEQAQAVDAQAPKSDTERTWFAKYMHGNVKREVGEYDEAVQVYEDIIDLRPQELGVLIALCQTLVDGAWRCLENGYFGKAAHWANRAIEVVQSAAKVRAFTFNIWKTLGDACAIFTVAKIHVADFPRTLTVRLLDDGQDVSAYALLADVDDVKQDILQRLSREPEAKTAMKGILHISILAHKRALHIAAEDRHSHAVAWYNLGWAEYRAHVLLSRDRQSGKTSQSSRYMRAAVRCFKRAIELEAKNSEFWNALGLVTARMNPKVSQHSFIRSLFLNDKNARTWTNLGTLYLLQDDVHLSNQAFTRAQSADPDYAHAWLGQGFLALLTGDTTEALMLFTHSFEISDASTVANKRQYALATFDHILTSDAVPTASDFIHPLFALYQLKLESENDWSIMHMFSLFLERIGSYSLAIENLKPLIGLDGENEPSSPSVIPSEQLITASADLARLSFATKDYPAALKCANAVREKLSQHANSVSKLGKDGQEKCRTSAILTASLSHYHAGSLDQAAEAFQPALQDPANEADVTCLLAQVQWASGDREGAKASLFESIENNPGHVLSVMLLGVIAVLDDDHEALDAVFDDLQGLRTSNELSGEDKRRVDKLLRAIAALASASEEDSSVAETAEVMTSIMLSPSSSSAWSQLAALTDDPYPAESALETARRNVQHVGDVSPEELATAFADTGKAVDMQRAIMTAPWMEVGWNGLCSVLSG